MEIYKYNKTGKYWDVKTSQETPQGTPGVIKTREPLTLRDKIIYNRIFYPEVFPFGKCEIDK